MVVLVACGGRTPVVPPPIATPADAGIQPSDAVAMIEDGPLAPIEDISIEMVSQTPGRHPRVPGTPNQQAVLDRQQLRDAIRQHMPGMIACYDKLSPNAFPKLHLEFTIRPDGSVANATATGARGELAACVVKVLETTPFPKPPNGGTIRASYQLSFDPVAGP